MIQYRSFLPGMLLFAAILTEVTVGQQARPPRPVLTADADTNDAEAYFDFGLEHLTDYPDRAAHAFYWASRLDPRWADPLYAQRVALLLAQPVSRQKAYLEREDETVFSSEIRRIDSLGYRAHLLNPFLHRGLDQYLLISPTVDDAMRAVRRTRYREETRQYLERFIENLVNSGQSLDLGPAIDGWLAYSAGLFPQAFSYFDEALEEEDRIADIEWLRAGMFYHYGQYDSARTSLTVALEELRERDQSEDVIIYESKALFEYAVGYVMQVAGDTAGAEAAYNRALLEDLAFYPAHLRLAALAAERGNPEETLGALETAVLLVTDDAVPYLALGNLLRDLGRAEEAEAHLRHAIALEPYYAEPHLILSLTLEQTGDSTEAIHELDAFIVRASRENPRRTWATTHRDSLSAALRTRR